MDRSPRQQWLGFAGLLAICITIIIVTALVTR